MGRSSSSSVRTPPSGQSSAMSMRMPLAPTSMTERMGGRGSAATATGAGVVDAEGAVDSGVAEAGGTGKSGARSANVHHRLQPELLLEQVSLVLQRPLIQGHVPPRANLQPKLRVASLRLHREDLLLVVVIEGVGDAEDRRQRADPVLVLLGQLRVALVIGVGIRL